MGAGRVAPVVVNVVRPNKFEIDDVVCWNCDGCLWARTDVASGVCCGNGVAAIGLVVVRIGSVIGGWDWDWWVW